jgi:acetoacetyl-CoA synthetase
VYAGKTIDLIPKVTEVVKDLSSKGLEHVILLPSIKTGREVSGGAIENISLRSASIICHLQTHLQIFIFILSKNLSTFLATDNGRPLIFEQLSFDHPLYILYSSGTTGPPKCIVHSAGVCDRHATVPVPRCLTKPSGRAHPNKERTHYSRQLEDGRHVFPIYNGIPEIPCAFPCSFFKSQTAWMMWPYMLGGLACGARIILYDGSPFYPDVKTYLRIIDEQEYVRFFPTPTPAWTHMSHGSHSVTLLGTSPRFLSEVQGRGILPRRKRSLPLPPTSP